MGELKFDKMEIDTRLAEEFFEANKAELDLFIKESKDRAEKIVFSRRVETFIIKPVSQYSSDLDEKLNELAKKIEVNAELFAQLEALKRRISKIDIKNYDIKMIVQNFKYLSNYRLYHDFNKFGYSDDNNIVLGETTPLAILGITAQLIKKRQKIEIHYCDTNAAICFLFARLCCEVGLNDFCNDKTFFCIRNNKVQFSGTAGVGVVTEHSDVDSAVDAFLASTSSPVEYKWKLQRIYVQESIYDRFKKTLSWKCTLNQKSGDQAHADVNPQSSHVFVYNQKVFLLDYAGTSEQIKDTRHVILVEAYRTSKELLTMLKRDVPFCVSLWSNDVCESNEIAYNLNANIVWINDYGVFDGPMKISQVIYNCQRQPSVNIKGADKLLKMADDWSKISFDDRVEKVMRALKGSNGITFDILFKIKEAINSDANKTVTIEKGKMWVVMDEPNGVVCQTLTDDDQHLVEILTSVAHGNICIWTAASYSGVENYEEILNTLQKENLPIIKNCTLSQLGDHESVHSNTTKNVYTSLYKTRVVYTNYGTIFAN